MVEIAPVFADAVEPEAEAEVPDDDDEDDPLPLPLNPFDIKRLDVTKAIGHRLYVMATKALGTLYSRETKTSFANFKHDTRAHHVECRLETVMDIKVAPIVGGERTLTRNLFDNPQMISCEDVRATMLELQNSPASDERSRRLLNRSMSFIFLNKSIDGSIKTMVNAKYLPEWGEDGAMYYKLIIDEHGVAQIPAVRVAKAELAAIRLDQYNDNVRTMHHAVRQLLRVLAENDSKPDDLEYNLFKAYKASKNQEFVDFAKHLSDDIDRRKVFLTLEQLMGEADGKYDNLVTEGKWKAQPGPKDIKILALQAQLEKYKQGGNKSNPSPVNRSNKKSERRPLSDASYPPWKLVPPGPGEPKSKIMEIPTKSGGTTQRKHHWCTPHRDGKGLWCTHTASECRLAGHNANKKSKAPDNRTQSYSKPKLVANNAAIVGPDDSPIRMPWHANADYPHNRDRDQISEDEDE